MTSFCFDVKYFLRYIFHTSNLKLLKSYENFLWSTKIKPKIVYVSTFTFVLYHTLYAVIITTLPTSPQFNHLQFGLACGSCQTTTIFLNLYFVFFVNLLFDDRFIISQGFIIKVAKFFYGMINLIWKHIYHEYF